MFFSEKETLYDQYGKYSCMILYIFSVEDGFLSPGSETVKSSALPK